MGWDFGVCEGLSGVTVAVAAAAAAAVVVLQIPRDADRYDLSSPPDMAYVFGGGYSPLSCSLVEHVSQLT